MFKNIFVIHFNAEYKECIYFWQTFNFGTLIKQIRSGVYFVTNRFFPNLSIQIYLDFYLGFVSYIESQ